MPYGIIRRFFLTPAMMKQDDLFFQKKVGKECHKQKENNINEQIIDSTSFIEKSILGQHTRIYNNCIIIESSIGNYSYVAQKTILRKTNIGKFCSIAENVKTGIAKHPAKTFVSTHPAFYSLYKQNGMTFADKFYFEEYGESITIGNDVWIGIDSIIMDGISIGDGAIIGAKALVTKDVPPYAIVGGVPAKIIKYRFDDETIKQLLNFKWWDKDDSWLKKNAEALRDINLLMKIINKTN